MNNPGSISGRALAFCFRRFHGLVEDLVRGAWVRFVRSIKENQQLLGEAADLGEFLFGSDRADLSAFRPILIAVQEGACFYCYGRVASEAAVDYFIPWSLYPVDLGHTFVLAHAECNRRKSDRLAAIDHLDRWCRRNEDRGADLAADFTAAGLLNDLATSGRITRWAYEQAEATGAKLWVQNKQLVDLLPGWRALPGMAA